MKKITFALVLVAAMLFSFAGNVSAHETRMYDIGNGHFQFVVGSLNEPIAVDDKAGVYLSVTKGGMAMADDDHHSVAGAVEGLDQTLKVEVSAGDKKKVMDLAPIHDEAGAYMASFIPTVQTTYTYRFFGTINNTPVDVSFSCNPAGHPATEEDKSRVAISDSVAQTLKKGAFGCPVAKADLGFPEPAPSTVELSSSVGSAKGLGVAALALAIVALGVASMKRRS